MVDLKIKKGSEVYRAQNDLVFIVITCLLFIIGYLVSSGSSKPPLCPFRMLTGLKCPLCGCTRSFAAVLKGDLLAAANHNPLGVVFALWLFFETVRRSLSVFKYARRYQLSLRDLFKVVLV